jgi:hypothetical protein
MPKEAAKEVKKEVAKAAALAPGESLPPGGAMGALKSGLVAVIFILLPTTVGVLMPEVAPDEWLKARLALADAKACPMAAGVLHVFVLQWLAMRVNAARVKYNVPWPTLYAEATHPHATAYNW